MNKVQDYNLHQKGEDINRNQKINNQLINQKMSQNKNINVIDLFNSIENKEEKIELDLSNFNLSELPVNLSYFKKLQKLNISKNPLANYDKIGLSLSSIPNLKQLLIDIKDKDDIIILLKYLPKLEILNNKIIKPNLIEEMQNYQSKIDLDDNECSSGSFILEIENYNKILKGINSVLKDKKLNDEFKDYINKKMEIVNDLINENLPNYLYSSNILKIKTEIYSFLQNKIISIINDFNISDSPNSKDSIGNLLLILNQINGYIMEKQDDLLSIINSLYNKIDNENTNIINNSNQIIEENNSLRNILKDRSNQNYILEQNNKYLLDKCDKMQSENNIITDKLIHQAKDIVKESNLNRFLSVNKNDVKQINKEKNMIDSSNKQEGIDLKSQEGQKINKEDNILNDGSASKQNEPNVNSNINENEKIENNNNLVNTLQKEPNANQMDINFKREPLTYSLNSTYKPSQSPSYKISPPLRNTTTNLNNQNNYNNLNSPNNNTLNPRSSLSLNSFRQLSKESLMDFISQLYKSKSEANKKNQLQSKPNETMEAHMYNYLSNKYGLKSLTLDIASSVIKAIKTYSKTSGEVCLFGLILRNELEENNINILNEIKQTLNDQIVYYLSEQYPLKNLDEINVLCNKIKNDYVSEELWNKIIDNIFKKDNNNCMKIKRQIYKFIDDLLSNNLNSILNKMKKNLNNMSISEKNLVTDIKNYQKKIKFNDLFEILLMYHIKTRDKYLRNFKDNFRACDLDGDGVLNKNEFYNLIIKLGIFNNDQYLDMNIDSLITQLPQCESHNSFSFSEIVSFFDNKFIEIDDKETGKTSKVQILDYISK